MKRPRHFHQISQEDPPLKIKSPTITKASKGAMMESYLPISFPDLTDRKITEIRSPELHIASEGKAYKAHEFLLSEIIEFDSSTPLKFFLLKELLK